MVHKRREAFLESGVLSSLDRVLLLAMDVDGVLTDGSIAFDSNGAEAKTFHVADGLGLVVLLGQGFHVAWISGRSNSIVERRASELNVPHVLQGVRDKQIALSNLCRELSISPEETAYIGDDWNDLPAFLGAGIRIAVANADSVVKAAADYVTDTVGGTGAVREVCAAILEAQGLQSVALHTYLTSLNDASSTGAVGQ